MKKKKSRSQKERNVEARVKLKQLFKASLSCIITLLFGLQLQWGRQGTIAKRFKASDPFWGALVFGSTVKYSKIFWR